MCDTCPGLTADQTRGKPVLVVDDDAAIRALIGVLLERIGCPVIEAATGQEAIAKAKQTRPALVLLDVALPGITGYEVCHELRETYGHSLPVIFISGSRMESQDRVAGLLLGADDYIVKPFDTPELLARIRGVLRRAREMRAQSPLTGLPGNVRIEEEIESRVSAGRPFAILYADLDHFKAYNDHYGFMRGDQVIQFTARIAQEVAITHSTDETFVGHVGGDDFVMVCPPESAIQLSQALVDRFDAESPDLYDDEDRTRGYVEVTNRRGEMQRFPLLSISIGIATTELRAFAHHAEAVAVATEMKSFTKTSAGSSWAVDRRTG